MPPGTDCPYPIRIFAVFEMIRILRQITEKQIVGYV